MAADAHCKQTFCTSSSTLMIKRQCEANVSFIVHMKIDWRKFRLKTAMYNTFLIYILQDIGYV